MRKFRTEYERADNHVQPAKEPATQGTAVPRPPFNVAVKVTGRIMGHEMELAATVDLKHLPIFAARLTELGFAGKPDPLHFDMSPEGLPICPKHRTPMKRRDKQKDTWHSHQLTGPDGRIMYCRGYPGPGSEGYDLDEPDPVDA